MFGILSETKWHLFIRGFPDGCIQFCQLHRWEGFPYLDWMHTSHQLLLVKHGLLNEITWDMVELNEHFNSWLWLNLRLWLIPGYVLNPSSYWMRSNNRYTRSLSPSFPYFHPKPKPGLIMKTQPLALLSPGPPPGPAYPSGWKQLLRWSLSQCSLPFHRQKWKERVSPGLILILSRFSPGSPSPCLGKGVWILS